jgi:predicted MFS family arabinose efflux permease
MTTTLTTRDTALPAQEPLITRPLLLRFVSIIGASASFYLPLSVVPLYARPAGSAATGLATGTLLLVTVAVELLTPRLVARTGYRLGLCFGLLFLGLPALALLGPPDLAVILAVSVARGAGFAVVVVIGGAMNVSLIPPGRRGAGLALAGLVSGVPALACLPLGVLTAARCGFAPVFIATAAAALLALVVVPWLPDGERAGHGSANGNAAAGGTVRQAPGHGVVSVLATPAMTRPAALFAAATVAAGVLVTVIPLAITQQAGAVAAIALFAQPAAATLVRLAAGRLGDRHGQHRLLLPGIGLAAAGMAAIAATGVPALVIGGAAVFGAGFGLLQNATLALMYARTTPRGYNAVSALWNAAYDAGMGAGAIVMGLVTASLGYPGTFLLTAAVVLLALIPAIRERHPRAGEDAGLRIKHLARS